MLTEFEENAVTDRLEGWELVEFLQIPIGHILLACLENDWITEDNIDDLRDLIGLKA